MRPLDPSPVTDTELARAMQAIEDAALVFDALFELASERQRSAILRACPFADWQDARLDYGSWLAVVVDGTTGLRVDHSERRSGVA